MKTNLLIVLSFAAGVVLGRFTISDRGIPLSSGVTWVLLALIFLVGVGVGANVGVWRILRDITMFQSRSIGSGFGYYSLSSVIITRSLGDMLGMTAGGAASMDTKLPVISSSRGKSTRLSRFSAAWCSPSWCPCSSRFF